VPTLAEEGMRRICSNFVWFLTNLLAGLRLTLPVLVSRRSFHISGDQALLLLLAAAGATLAAGYPFGAGAASFASHAWAVLGPAALPLRSSTIS
jgi:hypothetical protein